MVPLALGGLVAGGVIAGLTQFFASRAGAILAGMGLTFVAVKGMQALIGYAITDIQTVVQFVNAQGGGVGALGGLGGHMLQFAAYAGLFDGINILIGGYLSYASMVGIRVVLARLA